VKQVSANAEEPSINANML